MYPAKIRVRLLRKISPFSEQYLRYRRPAFPIVIPDTDNSFLIRLCEHIQDIFYLVPRFSLSFDIAANFAFQLILFGNQVYKTIIYRPVGFWHI